MRSLRKPLLLLLCLALSRLAMPMIARAEVAPRGQPLVFFGTYTGGKSRGIYVSRFDLAEGKLSAPQLAAETRSPSFLAVHPNGRWLSAVGEIDDFGGKKSGSVSAFSVDKQTGHLTLLNVRPSGGSGPCHLALDRTGKCLLAANYGSGSVATFSVASEGQLNGPVRTIQHHGSSVNPQRQEGPHAHFIAPDRHNRFALACDLGLDQVLVYRLKPAQAALEPNNPPFASVQPGSGPRHLAFHPNGRFVYLINELSSTITVFAYDGARGQLHQLQTVSTLPGDFKGQNTCAEVQIHPSGKFVYGSNRGHNSLALFRVEAKSGKLTFAGCTASGGKTPRHFTLAPNGRWLLAENQDSDNVVVFQVDQTDGRLQPTGQEVEVGAPVCAVFVH